MNKKETPNPKVSLITCTGGRPEAFALCEKWISRQTFKNFEWIVVDDCEPPTKVTLGQRYFRGPRVWSEGVNTQRDNMDLALSKVKGDFIFVIEDDDYYAPNYLASMMTLLSTSHVVGISNSRYFKVDMPGFKTMNNYKHSSLAQTGFRKEYLNQVKWAVNSGEFYFDVKFWNKLVENKTPFTLISNSSLSVGIKGLPGRPGLTSSHRENKGYMMDPSHKTLESWIGSDAENYKGYSKRKSLSPSNVVKAEKPPVMNTPIKPKVTEQVLPKTAVNNVAMPKPPPVSSKRVTTPPVIK